MKDRIKNALNQSVNPILCFISIYRQIYDADVNTDDDYNDDDIDDDARRI